jgi:hypothetical protein
MSFCAVCIADIPADAKPRFAPLGRDGANVRICANCDTQAVRDPETRHTVSNKLLDPRALRIKEHRQDLRRRGICVNGELHGPATHGTRCEACWARDKRRDAERRGE